MKKGSLTEIQGCSVGFLQQREHHAANRSWTPHMASTAFLSKRMDIASDLYKKDLYAHFGCVNAIEFSTDGNFLVSGGDDRRVLLWNLSTCLSGSKRPMQMTGEHNSNIFCLGFDSINSKVYSAGNDEQVLVHDLKTGETINIFMHDEAVYGVCVNPIIDSIFASAGEDGQVLLYDIRAPASADPLLLAKNYDAFYSVQFHPIEPMFIVTANSKEGVGLWDVRKPRVPVIKYGGSPQSSMCAKFNQCGSQIVALRGRLPPVLFNTQTPSPMFEFDADHYYNSCTMKSCCFAGARDQFILSGSDDFNLYMWRIPDSDSNIHLVSEPHLVLQGHRSIVNQVRFNPQNSIIASSGVEKIVKLWSPMSLPGSSGGLSNVILSTNMTRKVYTHEEYIGLVLESEQNVNHDYTNGCTEEDPRMMAFFDSLVQREVEGYTTNTDVSDDDEAATTSDTDTETSTSQSPVVSSHSDISDSESLGIDLNSPSSIVTSKQNTSSAAAPLPIRKRHLLCSSVSKVISNRSSAANQHSNRTKPSPGSEWILKLIAKKRAQLKAAKREKRKRRRFLATNQMKYKKHSFLKCFTTTNKSYLYQPERTSSNSEGLSSQPSSVPQQHGKQPVAPYTTILIFDGDKESDDDSYQTSLNARQSPHSNFENSPSQTGSLKNSTKNPKKRQLAKLWSSYSSCSSDDETVLRSLSPKQNTLKKKRGSENSRHAAPLYSQLNCVASEIVDSGSTSKVEDYKSVPKSSSYRNLSPSREMLPDSLTDKNLTSLDSNFSIGNSKSSENQIPLDFNSSANESTGDIIQISSISTDNTGSISFELNESIRVSQSSPLNNVGACHAALVAYDGISNGDSNDKSYEGSPNADTPDSGISMTTPPNDVGAEEFKNLSLEKNDKKVDLNNLDVNGAARNENSNSSTDRIDFSLKRQILKSRLKSYRPRDDDI